jgi:AAA domain
VSRAVHAKRTPTAGGRTSISLRPALNRASISERREIRCARLTPRLLSRPLVPPDVAAAARRLEEAMWLGTPLLAPGKDQFYTAMLSGTEGPLSLVSEMGALKLREQPIKARFIAVPKVDYVGTKGKIESLNTQALAEYIDERFIEFYDTKKNDALALGKIIWEKKRFPIDKFADIQRAFPCIIAGLRDYAEFIPLEREIFDLVIIDEASQVSIAQALPAIIRAKKVLVLGDRNQFGNVKTSNAPQEVNVAFMQDLIKSFTEDYADVSDAVRTKIDLFNIRSSVLDFVEPISNFAIQLKKHFRSYPEMISFSSKYFYGDNLQVMKIRGKPIEEVIEFDTIDHDGLIDQRNVNALEAKRIVEKIAECLDRDPPPTVGVITPHTEQQAYIAKLVGEHPQSEEFYDKLRLKIMTFDTCQGEEREIIFYSLVATEEKDRLAYVFPSKLDRDHAEEVDHNLRLQRLNVGLSRGQEKIVFVHSKALEKYASALRVALGQETKESLVIIRLIRNAFAHAPSPVRFSTPEIEEACALLKVPARVGAVDDQKDTNATGRERFRLVCERIGTALRYVPKESITHQVNR